jgi:predicted ATPase
MITRLRFINFRSHVDTEIPMQPINLFIGPVASGKSNVFKGLSFLATSLNRSFDEMFPPGLREFHWVRSSWAGETDPLGLEVDVEGLPSFPNERARYTIQIADSPEGVYVLKETLQRQTDESPWQWVFQRRKHKQGMGEYGDLDPYEPTILQRVCSQDQRVNMDAPGPRFAWEVAKSLRSISFSHLEISALKFMGDGLERDRIAYNGEHLPDFIAWTKNSRENASIYEKILGEMREILPDLIDILVVQMHEEKLGIAMSFKGQRGYITAPDLSDGTLLTLGLLCIIHGPNRPSMLCIEEPETGLHPRRLRWLFDHFMNMAYPSQGQTPTQVLLSTHSPYMVDFFGNMQECVQVFDQRQGRTQVAPLTKIQKEQLHQQPDSDEPIGHLWAAGLYENL